MNLWSLSQFTSIKYKVNKETHTKVESCDIPRESTQSLKIHMHTIVLTVTLSV